MKILLIGATGTIGSEIRKLLKDKNEDILAVSRNTSLALDIEQPKEIAKFMEQYGPFDAIICAAGYASFGKLKDLSDDEIQRGINSKLMGQVNLVRYGIPKLNKNGCILLTGGMLAYSPWEGTSNVAMVNAGLEGFIKGVAKEVDADKRVNIVHPPLLKESAKKMKMDESKWPPAKEAAEAFVAALYDETQKIPVFLKGYAP